MSRPTLYFDAAGIEALRQRAATTHQRYAAALRSWVDAHLDRQPLRGLDATFMDRSSEVYFEETFSFLSNVMLTYLMTGDARYADVAREWLRTLCTYPETTTSYAIGPYVAALAQGYDWLADVLPPAEQEAIRRQLTSLVRWGVQCASEPGHAWWYRCYLHHDFWIPVAGCAIGALALLDEVPEAEGWLRHLAGEVTHIFEVLADDGAWHEGAADWVYGLVLVLLFADAYRRKAGVSLYDQPWLRNTWRFRLYSWLPDDTYVYLNDSFRSGRYNILGSASCHVLRKLAGEYGNGYAQWLAERDERFDSADQHPGVYRSPYTWLNNRPYAESAMHMLAWNLLWYDPSVAPRPPDDLPLAHNFANQGLVVARTGWQDDASVVTFSCGPIGGQEAQRQLARGATHAHAQANSFTLFARGHYHVVPPGYGRAASRFENTVAISGNQVWESTRGGDMQRVELTSEHVYALGDATACLPGEYGVTRYVRHLLLLPPDFLVLCDLIEGEGGTGRVGRTYAWLAHSDPAEVAVSTVGHRLLFVPVDGSPGIEAHVLLPEIFGWVESHYRTTDGVPLLDETAALITFQVPRPATFVTVFALTERALAMPVGRLIGEHCVGAVLGGETDPRVVAFVRQPAAATLRYRLAPARSGRHLLVGLAPDADYAVSAALAPRDQRWQEAALGTAGERFANEVTVTPGGGLRTTSAGVLDFRA
jgi:hypothetical protein